MPERSWTPAQKNAIEARDGTLIVSAAAGSGKTAVLVERVIGIICDLENPVDVDKLLIVTFSIAAAAEMRQRIGERLSELIRLSPENYHLQRQQALLQKAQISTIHSFCLSIIRANFQNLPVSSDFSIADQSELDIMKNECAANVIERFYQKDDGGVFLDLVELISSGRDDYKLAQTMLRIYDFSRSHPFYENWLDSKAAMYSADIPVSETIWGKAVLEYARESLEHCHSLCKAGVATLADCDEKLQKAYSPAFSSDLWQLEDCVEFAVDGSWDDLAACLDDFVFERLGPVRGEDSVKEQLKAARDRVKKTVQELKAKYFCATQEQAAEDMQDLMPKIEVLFELVKAFGKELDAAKAEKRRLDFSDLEHLALSLLVSKDEMGYISTKQAGEIAQTYEYVLVDEYQDTNEVQDLIFRSVSREQKNLFMVGDVKQSIYSFRQAMPEIFLAKKAAFFPFDNVNYPAAIMLDINFRSRLQVTQGVNYIFSLIMSGRMGEVDYNEEESLKCGAVYPEHDAACPELMLIAAHNYSGEKEPDELEAGEVAAKIHKMITDGFMVSDKQGLRPAVPGDFCILLRSPKNRADTYVKALTQKGIPAWAENAGGYLAAREVGMIFSLLKALDNPLLDIELVSALVSPLFDFSDDDIANMRMLNRKVPFYSVLCESAAGGNRKSADFLEIFTNLQREANSLSADRLLLRIYEKTNALDIVRAMPMGESRRANLLLLVEYAAHYHAAGYKRLGGFVSFVTRLEERGGDLAPANSSDDAANTVRIMSVHKSKGLEFPVVILAGTAKNFNKEDLRASALLHSKYGFACMRRDMQTMKQFSTVQLQAIRLEVQRSILSEEMRILYVALTRAREKLVVVASVKQDLAKKLSGLDEELVDGKLSAYAVGEAASWSDWMIMSLLRHKSAKTLREYAGLEDGELLDDGNKWIVSIKDDFDEEADESPLQEKQFTARANEKIIQKLEERMAYVYPYLSHTKIPVKLAVSSAAKKKHDVSYRFAARPSFIKGEKLTAAEKGNAMHKFMQFADYTAAKADVKAEITRMYEKKYLSKVEVESLSAQKLKVFFDSGIADRIFASSKVWRELRFVAEFGQEELGDQIEGLDNESKVVLQGVADCVFMENECAVIVDYKTDHVKNGEELKEKYSAQLEFYKKILSNNLGIAVSECILYSFALSEEIKI